MRRFTLALDDSSERTQRLVYRFCVREDLSNIRVKHDYVRALRKSTDVLSAHASAEVIFFQHVWGVIAIRLLTHALGMRRLLHQGVPGLSGQIN